MKGTKMPRTMQPMRGQPKGPKTLAVDMARQERMIRRTTNHNVHVITPHGKIQAGRKGRNG